MDDLKNYIKSYRNFPSQGIIFRDALGILQETDIFNKLIINMSSNRIICDAEAIIAIDARGFIFGTAISLFTSKPMVVARKKGKLPGELVSKSYELEYGKDYLTVQKDSLNKFGSFAIVDDLLATGGTANCVNLILKDLDKKITGLVVVIELEKLMARKKLSFPISSQVQY